MCDRLYEPNMSRQMLTTRETQLAWREFGAKETLALLLLLLGLAWCDDLGGDEHVSSRRVRFEAPSSHSISNLLFVFIVLGAVDVTISRLERRCHRSFRHLGWALVHTKTQNGHLDARLAQQRVRRLQRELS